MGIETAAEPTIVVHAIAASLVLALGPINLLRPRRDRTHRLIGRVWAGAMVLTCLSAFGIGRGLSWLHGLAVFTLCGLTVAVLAIRRGDVRTHRFHMTGAYLGTLVAFGFAIAVPDRLLARMAVEDPASLLAAAGLVVAFAAIVVSLASGRIGLRRKRTADGHDCARRERST